MPLVPTVLRFVAVTVLLLGGLGRATAQDAIRALIAQSVESEKSKSYQQGIDALVKEYSGHQTNYLINFRLGVLYNFNNQPVEALKHFQAAAQLSPKSIEALHGQIVAHLTQKDWPAAETVARKLLTMDPNNYFGKLRLEVALREQKKYKEAATFLQQLLVAYPADAAADFEWKAMSKTQDSAALTARPAEIFDDKTETAWQASLKAEESKNYGEAIKALADAIKAKPKSYQLNVRLGWLAYSNSDYKASEGYYDTAIKAAPLAVEGRLGRLSPLLMLGRWADVEAQATQILRAEPMNFYGNYWFAYAVRMQNKARGAEAYLERITAAYPSDPRGLLELAMIHAVQPLRKATARDLLQTVLALDPGNATATQQLRDLK